MGKGNSGSVPVSRRGILLSRKAARPSGSSVPRRNFLPPQESMSTQSKPHRFQTQPPWEHRWIPQPSRNLLRLCSTFSSREYRSFLLKRGIGPKLICRWAPPSQQGNCLKESPRRKQESSEDQGDGENLQIIDLRSPDKKANGDGEEDEVEQRGLRVVVAHETPVFSLLPKPLFSRAVSASGGRRRRHRRRPSR